MTPDLFAHERIGESEPLSPGAVLLHGCALAVEDALLSALDAVLVAAPPRRMTVPGGHRMSVAMTSCGALGWISDARGYRYAACDPERGVPWPELPGAFSGLALDAARRAGYGTFEPDACLINVYAPGARLSLHRDADEPDRTQPVVSVSLGLPAAFLWGGLRRQDPVRALALAHGDVVVWGGPARLAYHGVRPLAAGVHPRLGARRVNLTLRRAGSH
jgi:alkylated DNA repair protein (DNA oxidative demethylase)